MMRGWWFLRNCVVWTVLGLTQTTDRRTAGQPLHSPVEWSAVSCTWQVHLPRLLVQPGGGSISHQVDVDTSTVTDAGTHRHTDTQKHRQAGDVRCKGTNTIIVRTDMPKRRDRDRQTDIRAHTAACMHSRDAAGPRGGMRPSRCFELSS